MLQRKVNIKVIDIPSVLEAFPIVLGIEKETFVLVILYHMPGLFGSNTTQDFDCLMFSEHDR